MIPLTVFLHARTTGGARANAIATAKRRPIRGVVIRELRFGDAGDRPLQEAYVSPLYPEGIQARDLVTLPEDHQAAVGLHWFVINFRPLTSNAQSGLLGEGVLGTMILGSGEAEGQPIETGTAEGQPIEAAPPKPAVAADVSGATTFDGEASFDASSTFGSKSGQPAGLGGLERVTAPAELAQEFQDRIGASILGELGTDLQSRSIAWEFIPVPDPLPIELDDVGRLQSEVDAAVVHRDAQALEAHLETIPGGAPSDHGRNYWPGAELLDDGLRKDLKEIAAGLRELAAARASPVAPVKKAVGRLAQARNKLVPSVVDFAANL